MRVQFRSTSWLSTCVPRAPPGYRSGFNIQVTVLCSVFKLDQSLVKGRDGVEYGDGHKFSLFLTKAFQVAILSQTRLLTHPVTCFADH